MFLKKYFSICSFLLSRSESAGSLLGSGRTRTRIFFHIKIRPDPDIRQNSNIRPDPDPDSESGTSLVWIHFYVLIYEKLHSYAIAFYIICIRLNLLKHTFIIVLKLLTFKSIGIIINKILKLFLLDFTICVLSKKMHLNTWVFLSVASHSSFGRSRISSLKNSSRFLPILLISVPSYKIN